MDIIKLLFNKGITLSNIVEMFTQTATIDDLNHNASTNYDDEHLHLFI
jgi:hypothetical protein